MLRKATAAIAAVAMLASGAALAERQWDDAEVRTNIQGYIVEQDVEPWAPPGDFEVAPGTPLPPEAQTHPFVGFEVEGWDDPEAYEYVVIDGSTVIVDAETREIVTVIDD